MNVLDEAQRCALRIAAEFRGTRGPGDERDPVLQAMLRQAFASGVLYGIHRSQHALGITHAAAASQGREV